MAKGIIYVMKTVVPGLIKIGKTGSGKFNQRMYELEHNGYRNVTGLQRIFAIEVEGYDQKETMLHTIFAKSRVGDTELFSVKEDIVTALLASFDGTLIYPPDQTKESFFNAAADTVSAGIVVPNGTYTFQKKKMSDGGKTVKATAVVDSGYWTLKQGSVLGISEDVGVSQKAKDLRLTLPMDENGLLLADVDLGACSPSFAGVVVMNQSINGWDDWCDKAGNQLKVYKVNNLD